MGLHNTTSISQNSSMPAGGSPNEAQGTRMAAIPPARLAGALRQGVRDAWDKLGVVLGVSFTGTLLLSLLFSLERLVPRRVPLPVHLLVLGALAALLLSAPLAGACHVAHLIATRDEVSYPDFWRGMARLWRPALLLGACDALALVLIGVNAGFYLRLGGLLGTAVGLLCVYLLCGWLAMCAYQFPLLVAQQAGIFDEPGKPARRGALAVVRRAFFLLLARPFYALGLLAVLLVITLLSSVTGVLFAMLWLALTTLLCTHAVRALLVQYGVLPPPVPEETPVPDAQFRLR